MGLDPKQQGGGGAGLDPKQQGERRTGTRLIMVGWWRVGPEAGGKAEQGQT